MSNKVEKYPELVRQIREELEGAAEEGYRDFSARLLPGVENLLGVRLGNIRKLAKRIAKNHAAEYLAAAPAYYFEEDMICGMLPGYAIMEQEERKNALRAFVPRIRNWSVCDSCCATYHFMKEGQEAWWTFLGPYFAAEEEYAARFACVCGIFYFINEEYMPALLKELGRMKAEGYYAKMAAAWAVSVCYIFDKKRTENFLRENALDVFTHNKALQKIRESHQVPQEEKAALLSLKRTESAVVPQNGRDGIETERPGMEEEIWRSRF